MPEPLQQVRRHRDSPPGEKLPAPAKALGAPIDSLFPRDGLPNPADLRRDAEYSQKQAAELLSISHLPLSNAERGRRRLNYDYVERLAHAYGVSTRQLLTAPDRSFGIQPQPSDSPVPVRATPRTVREKISYLSQHSYADAAAPSDAEIASAVSAYTGAPTTADVIAGLRSGDITDVSAAVREGLALALQVDAEVFRGDTEMRPAALEFVEAVRFLESIRRGQILGLAACGNSNGWPPR